MILEGLFIVEKMPQFRGGVVSISKCGVIAGTRVYR
jgi:hypothetical protein